MKVTSNLFKQYLGSDWLSDELTERRAMLRLDVDGVDTVEEWETQ